MSVHWKSNASQGNCVHCGRITGGTGCVCPESSSGRRGPPPRQQGKAQGKGDDFWQHDHFGLMDRFKE